MSPPGRGAVERWLGAGGAAGGALLALVVLGVVAMMIVPLPTWLLDLLIAANLGVSVTLLLAAVYARDALAIATFPTLLVLTTLYRLGLNVSTTRLILLRGDAGGMVRAFGGFVVGGDYIVGAAVFLILTIVQYLVIARGAERVAEVAARFTLDALPGRQLAIDADLRAAAIDSEEARRRRGALGREAQLYGALDGAMRFVKGDAVAGILILFISIAGGLFIAVVQRGMGLGEAAKLYTLLTIGDGLVSQLPALLVSTAAGLIVTRVAPEEEGAPLGADVLRQLTARPIALALVAGLLLVLALVPGLPLWPLALVSLPFAFAAVRSAARSSAAATPLPARAAVAPLEVAVDPALDAALPDLAPRLEAAIARVVEELALPVPPLARTVDASLPPRGFEIRLRGMPLSEGVVPDGRLLADLPPPSLDGVDAVELFHPLFGAAAWIPLSARDAATAAGATLYDSGEALATALEGTLRVHAGELLGFEETQRLVDALARTHPAVVREVVGKRVDVALLAEVLRRLVLEGVPINPRDVLEAIAQVREVARDPELLAEQVRVALRRHITRRLARGRRVAALVLDPLIEETLREAVRATSGGAVLALEPALADEILAALRRELRLRPRRAGGPLSLLVPADLRRHVRRLVEGDFPHLPVVTFQELNPDVRVDPVGRISV